MVGMRTARATSRWTGEVLDLIEHLQQVQPKIREVFGETTLVARLVDQAVRMGEVGQLRVAVAMCDALGLPSGRRGAAQGSPYPTKARAGR